ncbi:NTP/NDP exchange transporter [Roseomonas populi]|uniref:MFS transporter n=1 Tax=Roseomonas populi TaxID=3121582 RepID=A0ABT1X1X0_9PROT|nr:MFS transporter [Roseomonas pecuniae]MCR0982085.1 MFS transporter [Roseomonas pecuniae]
MASKAPALPERGGLLYQGLRRIIDVRPAEARALAWSWLYVFALFLAYYVLRPIRDELGVAGGVRNLPWLFTGTLLAMLAVNPLFAYAVRKWPRERFIAISYRFFMLNLLVFMLLLMFAGQEAHVWIGRAFFIWVSVFNLFVVSVFWSFVVDVFDAEQGKRLFGFLAAGATVGGIAGSGLTSGFVEKLGQNWLLLASIVLLEVAVFASRHLSRISDAFQRPVQGGDPNKAVGGGIFAGMTHTFRSPYLLGIAFFILFYSVTSTFLYFQQATIAEASFPNRAARTAFFADIDFWVNVLTLVFQLFLTGRLMGWLGVAITLCALPLFSVAGFAALAAAPSVTVFVAVQVVRRVSNFALARPTREVLFTSVPREDRYKAKNFIDTVVYRGGDQVASWSYAGLIALGLSMTGISIVAVPLSVAWLALSFWLGRRQERAELAEAGAGASPLSRPA